MDWKSLRLFEKYKINPTASTGEGLSIDSLDRMILIYCQLRWKMYNLPVHLYRANCTRLIAAAEQLYKRILAQEVTQHGLPRIKINIDARIDIAMSNMNRNDFKHQCANIIGKQAVDRSKRLYPERFQPKHSFRKKTDLDYIIDEYFQNPCAEIPLDAEGDDASIGDVENDDFLKHFNFTNKDYEDLLRKLDR